MHNLHNAKPFLGGLEKLNFKILFPMTVDK